MRTFCTLATAVLILGGDDAAAQLETHAARMSDRVYPYWTVFEHPRYGYSLPVPPGVRSIGEPETAIRTRFVSPDGAFVMSAWGGVISQPPQLVMDDLWTRATRKPGRTVNYQRKGRTWYVVSGTDTSETEFYEKFTMRGNHVAAFRLTYPRSRLREFDRWVVGIERSFALNVSSMTQGIAPAPMPHADRGRMEWDEAFLQTDEERSRTSSSREPSAEPVVDITPPPKPPELSLPRLEPPDHDDPASSPDPTKKSDDTNSDIPFAEKVPGKPGFVYTPFYSNKTIVDVEGIAAGTKVECPYTRKIFRVP